MLDPQRSFVRPMLDWHEGNGRHRLPWREPDRSAFEILTAEILLQRTTAASVAGAYLPIVARYPSPETVVAANPEAIERRIAPLSLAKRAEFIRRTSQQLVARHSGDIPRRYADLLNDALAPSRRGSDFQHAMLDFAADVCTARTPQCETCPFGEHCRSSERAV